MPVTRDIQIHRIAHTVVDREAVRKWLDQVGADKFVIPPPDEVSDPALVIALAAKRCYMAFAVGLNPNVTRVRESYVDYFDNILASGHGSVLEHSTFTYAIENVTRVFTAEMNRHRAGMAISEGSLRFIRFSANLPYWLPLSLRVQPTDDEELKARKLQSQEVFFTAFLHQEECYGHLEKIWDIDGKDKNFSYKKKVTSCFRRIVGMGVCTGGVWTGNIRALRHIFAMRASPQAEEEICHVFSRIAADMATVEPLLFGDFQQTPEGYWVPKYPKV